MPEELHRARAEDSKAKLARTRAVLDQFLTEGAKLSTTSIAYQAGVSPSFVHKHFGPEIIEAKDAAAAAGASPAADIKGVNPELRRINTRMHDELTAMRSAFIGLLEAVRVDVTHTRGDITEIHAEARRLWEAVNELRVEVRRPRRRMVQRLYSLDDARIALGGLDIEDLLASGRLGAVSFNGQDYVKAGSLEAFLESLNEQTPPHSQHPNEHWADDRGAAGG
jgi:hypothetical protein